MLVAALGREGTRRAGKVTSHSALEQPRVAVLAALIIPQHADSQEGAMERSHRVHVGNRVRTIRKHGNLPKGSSGTIVRAFDAVDCSDVQFDAYPGHRLVANSDLEFIEQVTETR